MSRAIIAFLTFISLVIWGSWCAAQVAPRDDVDPRETGGKTLDVPYVTTPQHVVDIMLGLARVEEKDLLYDLGCGDGRIVVTAAQRYGCRALGVDIDPARVRDSLQNVEEAGLEDLIAIRQQDVFELDLSKADVVTLFLTPKLNVRLIPQLDKMKPGSRIVSHDFDMQGVEPTTVVNVVDETFGKSKLYLWEVPLNKVPIEDAPLFAEEEPSVVLRTFDGIWDYMTKHTYQRFLVVAVMFTLAITACVGLVQRRRQDRSDQRMAA